MDYARVSPSNPKKQRKRQADCRFFTTENPSKRRFLRLHPLFWLVGVWYCVKGELFLFLMSCLVALQHECAHAFAAAKLGYSLNRIVLMPFGAVIDGDLNNLSFKDEITVALYGPLCNLFTAAFFAALWWFAPTMYAFTDTACFTSLSIALVNLLPAYPLDGGRIFRCALCRAFLKRNPDCALAERKADRISRAVTFAFAFVLLFAFIFSAVFSAFNLSLLAFATFLFFGGIGNKNAPAVYGKLDFACKTAMQKGMELRRVAIAASCPIKDALRYVEKGSYLVLEIYDENENKLFELPQNRLSACFLQADSPYTPLSAFFPKSACEKNKTR